MLRSRSIIIHSTLDIFSNMGSTEFDWLWLPKGKMFRDTDAVNHEGIFCCYPSTLLLVYTNTQFSQDVYEAVALDTVSACLRGFSGAIFVYGQTSSGNTWTITGRKTSKDRGIAPRVIRQLFGEIRGAECSGLPVRYRVSSTQIMATCLAETAYGYDGNKQRKAHCSIE